MPVLAGHPRLKRGASVLLKINLLSANKGPDKPVNTHPSFIRSLATLFQRKFDATVYVGDSTSSFSKGSTDKAFKNMGIDLLAAELGLRIMNVDTEEPVVLKNGANPLIKEIAVPKKLREIDIVVSVPKLKTHELTGFTGAVKNMLGCVPGKMKRDVHVKAPTSRLMAEALCDVYSFVRPDFAVMDGVVGMQGSGPAAGEPAMTGLIAASADPVSLDAVVTHLLGYGEGEVLTTVRAHARGLGTGDLRMIEVVGETLEACRRPDFRKPSNRTKLLFERFVPPGLIGAAIERTVSFTPRIDPAKCVRCFECVKGCPAHCIPDVAGKLVIDTKRCIECFCCQEVCPANAVTVRPPLTKIMLGKIQQFIEAISG